MQYTILEMERIEKVLRAKLQEAWDAYSDRERIVQKNFRAQEMETSGRQEEIAIHGDAAAYQGEPVSGELSKRWNKFQEEDMDLSFLWGEKDLFERGINSLYSYWNSAVEIFIDKMRTRTEKEFPEGKRYVDPLDEERIKFIRDNE